MTTSAFDRQMDVADALIVLRDYTNGDTVQRQAVDSLDDYTWQLQERIDALRAEVERLKRLSALAAEIDAVTVTEPAMPQAPAFGQTVYVDNRLVVFVMAPAAIQNYERDETGIEYRGRRMDVDAAHRLAVALLRACQEADRIKAEYGVDEQE